MPFDATTLAIVCTIAFAAYVLFAMSGFGSNLVTVPLLGHLYPLTYVLPMLATLDFVAAARVGFQSRGHRLDRELAWLLPSLGIGIVLGTTLLVNLPPALMLGTLGALIFAYGLRMLSPRPPTLRLPQWTALPLGMAGGVISALFGTGGPIYVSYLTARGHPPEAVRSTITTIIALTAFTRIGLYIAYGLFAQENVLVYAAGAAPAMLAGIWLGHRIHLNLSKQRLTQCMAVLLVLSGGSLLLRVVI